MDTITQSRKTLHATDAASLAEAIAQRCDNAKTTSTGWQACCPAHEDTTPSLSITPAADKVLLRCYAGCSAEAIVAALGLSMADLFVHQRAETYRGKRIVATYDYLDASGTLVHQTVRFADKTFGQRRPHPTRRDAWIWNLKGVETVLYHLPQVAAAIAAGHPVFVVEGEKDVDTLTALGLPATCNAMGAGKWAQRYSEALRGARVVILPDNDVAGRNHAEQVARSLTETAASIKLLALADLPPKGDVSDWLQAGHAREELEILAEHAPGYTTAYSASGEQAPEGEGDRWRQAYSKTKGQEIKETFGNLCMALQHTAPWSTDCWYDVVREIPMCGSEPFSDALVGRVAIALERTEHIAIRTLRLLQAALVHHCRAQPRDPLKEWLESLPPWDEVPRLTTWLSDHAGAPRTAYGRQVARLWPVSMVARALHPGCQCRSVIILEGPENLGKSKLVHTLAGAEWSRELSRDLEGKEAHMLLEGVWLAELAELASLSKTEDARLKSFITMEKDVYIPKFSNNAVSRLRRTVFVGTVNPEGEGTYLRSQTGNSRFLPLRVTAIDVPAVETIRVQLFAEALVYYRAHPSDWWRLSANGENAAAQAREARRQGSIYENSLGDWLEGKHETTWEEIAEQFIRLEAKERWKDRVLQMEIAKALRALGWRSKQEWARGKNTRVWYRHEAASDDGEDLDEEEEGSPSPYVDTGV